ncbi:MAG: YceI family protein [Pseudomonadota bacterium]
MKHYVALFLVGIALSGCARLLATIAPEPTTTPSELRAGDYRLDPEHVSILFKIDHLGFSTYVGRFEAASGQLDFKPEDPAASAVSVTVDATSLSVPSAELEEKLKGPALFDLADFPVIRFESTGAKVTGEARGTVEGLLTIKTVERPITLDVTFNGGARNPITLVPTLGFSATAQLDRDAFGLTEWLPLVGNQVTLEIEAEFIRTPSS